MTPQQVIVLADVYHLMNKPNQFDAIFTVILHKTEIKSIIWIFSKIPNVE